MVRDILPDCTGAAASPESGIDRDILAVGETPDPSGRTHAAPIVMATNNAHKVDEIRRLLPASIRLVTPAELGLSLDVEETGSTFEENAILKARAFATAAGLKALADDSGLVVDALRGAPGVLSARYGGSGLSDAERVRRLLSELRGVPDEMRSARFVCVVALVGPGARARTFAGQVEGRVTRAPRGSHGFGYDPVFLYSSAGKTFAEMSGDEKDAVSHRARALREAAAWLTGS